MEKKDQREAARKDKEEDEDAKKAAAEEKQKAKKGWPPEAEPAPMLNDQGEEVDQEVAALIAETEEAGDDTASKNAALTNFMSRVSKQAYAGELVDAARIRTDQMYAMRLVSIPRNIQKRKYLTDP